MTSSIITDIILDLPFDDIEKAGLLSFFTDRDASKVESVLSKITKNEIKAEYLRKYVKSNVEHQDKIIAELQQKIADLQNLQQKIADLQNLQNQTKIKIMHKFHNGLQFIKPKPLLHCTGLEWTYQPAKTLYEDLRYELTEHYKNFLQINFDKTYIPIYLFLSGAGTGKSRNAEEFHRTAIACLSEDEDFELKKKIESAFVFSVGFENGNSLKDGVEQNAYNAIGIRMLNQLLPDQELDLVIADYEAPLPWEVFKLVSRYENRKLEDMTIILIIDGIQNIMKSKNDWNDRSSEFFITLTNVHDLALKGIFLIPLCTATIADSVDSVLRVTHRKRVYLPVASLEPPTIIKDNIVTSIFQTDDHIIKILVNDCGGHGRALEVLQEILKGRDIQNANINDMMNDLRVRLRDRYCEALTLTSSEARAIARATLTKHLLEFDKYVPGTNKFPDQVVQPGLIRYVRENDSNAGYFDIPYIWIWILTNSSNGKDPVLRDWSFCDYGDHRSNNSPTCPPGSQFWQHFEHFVASFRVLKSRNINDGESTSISRIHIGARLNGNFKFKNYHLELECAVHQEDTNSSSYGNGKKMIKCDEKTVDVRECKHCIINGASAPHGDAFLGLDTNLKSGKPNEVHQYKRWKVESLNEQNYKDERKKSASNHDFFILFTTARSLNFKLPKNSGIVDASNWDRYFGPYAGRAHIYAEIGPLNINKASRRDLMSVYGISDERADVIIAKRNKREFEGIEDAKKETGIPERVLKRFKFKND